MNFNYLSILKFWGLVSAAYFLLATSGKAQVILEKNELESDRPKVSTSAKDLLAQQNGITEVTGVQLNQTDRGLEVILETAAGEQLVPLIFPEGNNLVIDILDATNVSL